MRRMVQKREGHVHDNAVSGEGYVHENAVSGEGYVVLLVVLRRVQVVPEKGAVT